MSPIQPAGAQARVQIAAAFLLDSHESAGKAAVGISRAALARSRL